MIPVEDPSKERFEVTGVRERLLKINIQGYFPAISDRYIRKSRYSRASMILLTYSTYREVMSGPVR